MSALRAIPHRLCMAEAVPFGQHFTYHAEHPIQQMLADGYFLPVKSNLRAGDSIRLVQTRRNRVRAVANVLVVEVGPRDVEIALLGEIREIPAKEEPGKPAPAPTLRFVQANGEVKWQGPQKKWAVFVGDEEVASGIGEKDFAKAIANGHAPIPEV